MSNKKPSYRRNRDYRKDFGWTYELKKDVLQCYSKAREDPSIGYTKKMKKLWDELHPEYNFLTEKVLRDQASRVQTNYVVMETEYNETTSNPLQSNIVNNENSDISNRLIDVNDQPESETNGTEQPTIQLSNEQQNILEKMKPIFLNNYDVIKLQSLDERVYSTRVN